ncbi:MAG: type II toxin-antitoxin system HicA family toxin [Methylococcaceae bacterium]|nr:type II toxin-antitoxin system HicA family toxin [Methylococcaceae bacterium]
MPKLPSSKAIIAVLLAHGFEKVSQKGSHHKYCKGNRIVIVPSPKKEIPIGTLQSIIKQAGLTRSETHLNQS